MEENEFENNPNIATVSGRGISISTKHSVEICRALRGMNLEKSKLFLHNVISKKRAVQYRRFTEGAGHKPGNGPGKYPYKAANEILKLLESVTSNAQSKGLATGKLKIVHLTANRGSGIMHRGRQRSRVMKQTHIKIAVAEESSKEAKK